MYLKDYILTTFDQTLIFSKYLNISQQDIKNSIHNPNEKICNPLRNDKHPSLSFKYYGNKLICKDFGDYRFRGDIFEIVGYVINKNCRNNHDFVDICNDIINNCGQDTINKTNSIKAETEFISKHNIDISFTERRPNKLDYTFWETYGIKKENIGTKIFIADRYRLNNWQTPYRYSGSDPCYVYNINPNMYKLYFPYREKHKLKFITNNRCPIECLHHLRPCEYICLIKGYKDKILLEQMCDELKYNDIVFLPMASETAVLNKELHELLLNYTNKKKIFTIFDTDVVGLNSAEKLKTEFNTIPIYFTSNYKSKDPSDMVRDYGYDRTFIQFKTVLNSIIYEY